MHELADSLRTIVADARVRLAKLSESEASAALEDGGWSAKQVIGHLIDSACNNHQRFVRLALAPGWASDRYEQDGWVEVQAYAQRPWADVVEFWALYNLHLSHVIDCAPSESLAHEGTVGGQPVTLRFLMEDYVAHLQHHLDSIR